MNFKIFWKWLPLNYKTERFYFIDKDSENIVEGLKERILESNKKEPEGVPNLLAIDDLNEDTLLANIEKRYDDSKIYTCIGSSILVSLNPYQRLPIYKIKDAKMWRNFVKNLHSGLADERSRPEPHLFMAAEEAYQDLIIDKRSQSIIITGESGAGKTEATKIILSYLAKWKDDFSSSQSDSADLSDPSNYLDHEASLEKQVLDSNPLLEAFGNAKTIKNNNSSRFGKFIQVNVDNSGKIISATIRNYLLEKSRIVHQNSKERNFHIFYYIFLDDNLVNGYELEDRENYNYISNSFLDGIPEEEDQLGYKIMKNCMKVLGFSDQEYGEVIDIIVGILNLGNIEFEEIYDEGVGDRAQITDETYSYLEKASRWFNVEDPEYLARVIYIWITF